MLFNISNSSEYSNTSSFTISFMPQKRDVGNYTINFSVIDSGGASSDYVINFSVLNINSAPFLSYACDNERNWNESNNILCYINASDYDEESNITFTAYSSWFYFNGSTNISTIAVNSAGGNASVLVNFTPDDLQVGWNTISLATLSRYF